LTKKKRNAVLPKKRKKHLSRRKKRSLGAQDTSREVTIGAVKPKKSLI